MGKSLTVNYPESLALALKLGEKDFEEELKTVSLIKLFEIGKISSGTAARILGISRLDFLEKLGKYQVSFFNFRNEAGLSEDVANA